MKTKTAWILLFVVILIPALACGSPNPLEDVAKEDGSEPKNFFNGVWDGITAVPAFIINATGVGDYNVYEVHNDGDRYNFGFLLGIFLILGGGSSAASSR